MNHKSFLSKSFKSVPVANSLPQFKNHPLLDCARKLGSSALFSQEKIETFINFAKDFTDPYGRVDTDLQALLYSFELEFSQNFVGKAASLYQNFVANIGAKLLAPIEMPDEATPLWLLEKQPYAQFQSQDKLPKKADFVVVGAGLTGTSAAYHLKELLGKNNKSIVILDAHDPASQATGRNGGNFELVPENFLGIYEGLPKERLKFLKSFHPHVHESVLKTAALYQASIMFRFCLRNALRFQDMVLKNDIACDFSPKGWLRIAASATEERGMEEEVNFAKTLGIDFTLWSKEQIKQKIKIPTNYLGRYALNSGNYHPVKFVNSLLRILLASGLELYTRTQVEALTQNSLGNVTVRTNRGDIEATRVILATNAFSSQLFKELEPIMPYQSLVMNIEHVENNIDGMTVTEKQGDLYYNFPLCKSYFDSKGRKRGTLLIGGGVDSQMSSVDSLERSKSVMTDLISDGETHFLDTKNQPPSRVWTGPMAFTPDRLPFIGPLILDNLEIPEIVVSAGFNGYGGSFCMEAGFSAAHFALYGKFANEFEAPVFSLRRAC